MIVGDYYVILNHDLYSFLYKANQLNINIYHLQPINHNHFQFVASHFERNTLKSFKEIQYQYSIGPLHFISLYLKCRRRYISLLMGFFWLFYLNQFSFGCIVDSVYPQLNSKVIEVLDTYGLMGVKYKYNSEQINPLSYEIHQQLSSIIDYFDIYLDGCIYKVTFTKKLTQTRPQPSYTSLIASNDGVIETIDVRKGNVLVKKGQYVSKGDLLVSNEIIATNDDLKYTEVDGKIYAYVYHTFEASMKGSLNPDTYTLLYQEVLKKVSAQIGDDGQVVSENVLHYMKKEGKISLKIQFTLYQNIAQKEFFNEQ